MKQIFLTESQISVIKESEEEITFYRFFTELKSFLKELLKDPINAKPGKMFTSHMISRSKLMNKMLDLKIIVKKEGFDEPSDADNNKKSVHKIKYSVPVSNFERKIHRLYSFYFERNKEKNEVIKEDGECGCDASNAGVTNASISANAMYDAPFGGVQKRSIYNNIDMKPALARKDGKNGSMSIPKKKA